jgi:hypothetical protein
MAKGLVFLRRSLRYWAISAIVCGVLAVFCIVMISIFGWHGKLIVALAAGVPTGIVCVIKAMRRSDGLTLDDEGFSYQTLGGVKRYRWADCSVIRPLYPKRRGGGPVVFSHPETDKTLLGGLWRLFGRPSGELPEPYGLDAHALAAMMNERRDRALACGAAPTHASLALKSGARS